MRDPTGRSRCFGFVSFADPVVVDIVLQKTHILDKKQVSRGYSIDQQHPAPQVASHTGTKTGSGREENKVFVGGIHIEADEKDLKEIFEQFGDVCETILMRDRESGRSRGFGFVTFATYEGAQKACNDTDLRIRGRRVEVKLAVPKGRTVATKSDAGNNASDPYAAWTEYFKQYPEYYEAMMKAYSNPATMAAYYNQYYGSSQSGSAPPMPASGAYDPTQYAALMAAMGGQTTAGYNDEESSATPALGEPYNPSDRVSALGESYNPADRATGSGDSYHPSGRMSESGESYHPSESSRYGRRHGHSRRSHRSRSRSRSPRSPSRSPSRERYRERRRDRDYDRRRHGEYEPQLSEDSRPQYPSDLHEQQYPRRPASPTQATPYGGDSYRPTEYNPDIQGPPHHPVRSYHPYGRSADRH